MRIGIEVNAGNAPAERTNHSGGELSAVTVKSCVTTMRSKKRPSLPPTAIRLDAQHRDPTGVSDPSTAIAAPVVGSQSALFRQRRHWPVADRPVRMPPPEPGRCARSIPRPDGRSPCPTTGLFRRRRQRPTADRPVQTSQPISRWSGRSASGLEFRGRDDGTGGLHARDAVPRPAGRWRGSTAGLFRRCWRWPAAVRPVRMPPPEPGRCAWLVPCLGGRWQGPTAPHRSGDIGSPPVTGSINDSNAAISCGPRAFATNRRVARTCLPTARHRSPAPRPGPFAPCPWQPQPPRHPNPARRPRSPAKTLLKLTQVRAQQGARLDSP